jgi:methyl-accepting chemotaxis protein/methyl-accepting chemotaxis protein-1 (serine sensor receptor)
MRTLVDEVKLGSEEQTRGIEQIAKAVTQMEQVTQSTAANAEECAAAAEEMNSQSASVRETVLQLKVMIGVSSVAAGPVHRARVSPGRPTASKLMPKQAVTPSRSALKASVVHKPVGKPEDNHSADASVDYSEFPLEEAFKEF